MHSAFVPDIPPCNPGNPAPRYRQVSDWLADEIRSGRIAAGEKLPAEKDWAPMLGVSQMTLNRAIQELVAGGLIVREVGRGTFVALAGNNARLVHIGVVLHWRRDSDGGHYGSQMLHGIHMAAAGQPARFSFTWGALEGEVNPDHYVALARQMGVDGLLLVIPPARVLPQILSLQRNAVPFIVVGASWPGQDAPCIDFDNATGTEMAVRHLLDQGHRNIGLIRGAMYLRNSQDRVETFHHVLAGEGIVLNPAWDVVSSTFRMDEAATGQLENALRDPDGPTAWFAAGYHLSMQAVEIIQRLALRIPEDISVMGFGDPYTAAYMHPPLTTIRHPIEALGELAAARLLDAIREGGPSPSADILPVELVVRKSTAPPKSARQPARAEVLPTERERADGRTPLGSTKI
jgi:DNA-binding LacI/PurR family transcriptional regulator